MVKKRWGATYIPVIRKLKPKSKDTQWYLLLTTWSSNLPEWRKGEGHRLGLVGISGQILLSAKLLSAYQVRLDNNLSSSAVSFGSCWCLFRNALTCMHPVRNLGVGETSWCRWLRFKGESQGYLRWPASRSKCSVSLRPFGLVPWEIMPSFPMEW